MESKIKSTSNITDKLLWGCVFLIIGLSVFAYYYFSEVPTAVRVIAWLGVIAATLVLAYFTQAGKLAYQFAKDSFYELYKVVWPTRKETLQNTALVIVLVAIFGLVVWLIDTILLKLIAWVNGL